MFPNATPWEWAWVITNVLGTIIELFAVTNAIGDRRALIFTNKNGARMLIANANIRLELFRLVILGILAGIGIIALFTPSSTSNPQNLLLAIIVGLGLSLVAILLNVSSYLDYITRKQVLAYIDQHDIMHKQDKLTHKQDEQKLEEQKDEHDNIGNIGEARNTL